MELRQKQNLSLIIGLLVLFISIAIGFIKVDEDTYMEWRFIFSFGEGITISCSLLCIFYGIYRK